jgi:uncharacterized protein (TIGR03792 family)
MDRDYAADGVGCPAMVVEFLTFTVPAEELDEWLEVEERNWSRFLERQPGFVRKEMWRSTDEPTAVHAVIWWRSMEEWQAVPAEALETVVAAMGEHERSATCVAYDVLRER